MCFLEACISCSILDMAQPTSHIPFKKDETQIMIFTRVPRLTPHAHLNFPFERWALSHYCSQGFLSLMSWISWSDKRKWYMLSCLPNNTCYILPLNPYPAIPCQLGKKMKAMLGNEQLYIIAIFMILWSKIWLGNLFQFTCCLWLKDLQTDLHIRKLILIGVRISQSLYTASESLSKGKYHRLLQI
jgi:hypothetical protein